MDPTPPSRPLPDLPSEIHQEILRFCDPSTLGRASQVSLAFLEFSSPLLYYDVEITSFTELGLLFASRITLHYFFLARWRRNRAQTLPKLTSSSPGPSCPLQIKPPQPHLLTFLSLNQIKNFTFAVSSTIASIPSPLSRDRIFPKEAAIHLDVLQLHLPPAPLVHPLNRLPRLPPNRNFVQTLIGPHLLPFFAPTALLIFENAKCSDEMESVDDVEVPSINLERGVWTRLESLYFYDATSSTPLSRVLFFKEFDLVIELSEELELETWWKMLDKIEMDLVGAGGLAWEKSSALFPCRALKGVEVWVYSHDKVEAVLDFLQAGALRRLRPTALEGRLSKIKVCISERLL